MSKSRGRAILHPLTTPRSPSSLTAFAHFPPPLLSRLDVIVVVEAWVGESIRLASLDQGNTQTDFLVSQHVVTQSSWTTASSKSTASDPFVKISTLYQPSSHPTNHLTHPSWYWTGGSACAQGDASVANDQALPTASRPNQRVDRGHGQTTRYLRARFVRCFTE